MRKIAEKALKWALIVGLVVGGVVLGAFYPEKVKWALAEAGIYGENFEPWNPAVTKDGRLLIAMARNNGATIPLTSRISLRRNADGTEIVIVRQTLATDWEYNQDGAVVIQDSESSVEGEIDLGKLDINGPIKAIASHGGKIVITGWVKEPVIRNVWDDDGVELIFPSSMAKDLGAGNEAVSAVQDTGVEVEATVEPSSLANVDQTVLAAVTSQEAGIVGAWKSKGKKLKGDDLRKRVETFEAYAAVSTNASPDFFDESTTATGLYAMTEARIQEMLDAKVIEFSGTTHDLGQKLRGHPDVATNMAVAYWLFLESQTFPGSPAAEMRFKAAKEAWCAIGLEKGVAEMRARIEAASAEDPTSDPLLQAMQPWYEALATYHASYPIPL